MAQTESKFHSHFPTRIHLHSSIIRTQKNDGAVCTWLHLFSTNLNQRERTVTEFRSRLESTREIRKLWESYLCCVCVFFFLFRLVVVVVIFSYTLYGTAKTNSLGFEKWKWVHVCVCVSLSLSIMLDETEYHLYHSICKSVCQSMYIFPWKIKRSFSSCYMCLVQHSQLTF